MTDGHGRTIDFRNTIIIMTSNVGADTLFKNKTLGFKRVADEAEDYIQMKERVMEQMKHTFRPEFLNRIDELIVFQSLSEEELKQIIDLLIKDLSQRIKDNGYSLEISDSARQLIMKEGYEPAYGARPLKRAIQKLVEDTVSEEILKKTVIPGEIILVDEEEGKIVVRKREGTAKE
jgi:ATP-dependent Clp protease ATP-binding subunit ClpC